VNRYTRGKLREAYQYLEDAQLSNHEEAGPLLITKALDLVATVHRYERDDYLALPNGLKTGDKGLILVNTVNTLDQAINLLEIALRGAEPQSVSECIGDALSHIEEAMDS
jgi:hypothetical protein